MQEVGVLLHTKLDKYDLHLYDIHFNDSTDIVNIDILISVWIAITRVFLSARIID